MRRRLAWGLALPLVLAGSQAAHALAYTLVYPEAHVRATTLLISGHAYLVWLPWVLGAAAAATLLSLGFTALDVARGRPARDVPAWAFALLSPAAFLLQEVLELSLHAGTFGWRAVLAPTFLPGLLLQLPFALTSYVVARVLLRAAERLGRALARPLLTPAVETATLFTWAAPISRAVAGGGGSRAPPCVAAI